MLVHSSKRPIHLSIVCLNDTKQKRAEQVQAFFDSKSEHKCTLFKKVRHLFKDAKNPKKNNKQNNKESLSNRHIFVLDFEGDIKASAVAQLREEISVIISSAKAGDEVVLRLDSGGGQVNAYGLAAAQLVRLKQAGLVLTVCVDKIAASGGYMMACVADKIIASDFAVLGSVGVVSQLPNFHELLKKHHIDYELFTAGEHKRTVTMFGENDDDDRAKHQADIDRIHDLFKAFVKKHRPVLDMEKIATGEIWFGHDAKALGLIDEIGTSDAYILSLIEHHCVLALRLRTMPTLAQKIGLEPIGQKAGQVVEQLISSASEQLSRYHRL